MYTGNIGSEQLCLKGQGNSLPMAEEYRYLGVLLSSGADYLDARSRAIIQKQLPGTSILHRSGSVALAGVQ